MKHIIASLSFALLASTAFAQAPQKFNYQGVARNTSGAPIATQALGLRITIHDGTATGTAVYQETQNVITNAYGLYNIAIGTGTIVTGTFSGVNWGNGDKFMQVEIDPAGGTSYVDAGTTQLLSVPYAMNASKVALTYFDSTTNANSLFTIQNNGGGSGIEGVNSSTTSSVSAVKGTISNTAPGGFSAAVRGINNGTGGLGIGMWGSHAGSGWGVYGVTPTGLGVYGNSSGAGTGVYGNSSTGTGIYGTSTSGKAAQFANNNNANNNTVLDVSTNANGTAGSFIVSNTNGTSPAVKGEVNSQFANFGTAGIYGLSSGTGGFAGLFYASNASGNGPAVIALTAGNGNGVTANAGKNGNGIETTCDGTGRSIYAWTPNFGTGQAARFANFNTANSTTTVQINTNGTGAAFLANHTGASGNIAIFQSASANVARIDKTGKGFFNGGTQASGADLAEAFDVTGTIVDYEPGDVMVIAADADRTMEKSSGPYSTLVAGVYATKPGVLLTEESVDTDISDKVPMGVVGVLPTKVCIENGAIKRGDLIVTSSIAGVAMKGDPDKVKPGQVIGKALQNYDGDDIGKIKVLVNVK